MLMHFGVVIKIVFECDQIDCSESKMCVKFVLKKKQHIFVACILFLSFIEFFVCSHVVLSIRAC